MASFQTNRCSKNLEYDGEKKVLVHIRGPQNNVRYFINHTCHILGWALIQKLHILYTQVMCMKMTYSKLNALKKPMFQLFGVTDIDT